MEIIKVDIDELREFIDKYNIDIKDLTIQDIAQYIINAIESEFLSNYAPNMDKTSGLVELICSIIYYSS